MSTLLPDESPPGRRSGPIEDRTAYRSSIATDITTARVAQGIDTTGQASVGVSTAVLEHPTSSTSSCAVCGRWLAGHVMLDGVRRCPAHATVADLQLLDALDEHAPGIGLPRLGTAEDLYAWPYGANADVVARIRLVEWAERHRLRLADRGHACLRWLRGRRCSVECWRPAAWWLDHTSLWTRDGKPAVLVAQPYHLSPQDTRELAALDAAEDLHVELSAEGSWYGHGTWFVGVWRVGA